MEIVFEACVQDAPEYGSDEEGMVSRVFFWIKRPNAPPGDFWTDLRSAAGDKFADMRISVPADYMGPMAHADVRQRVGADLEMDPAEVGPPQDCPAQLNKDEFSRQAMLFFRSLASESGVMMRVIEGKILTGGTRPSKHIRLSHNVWAKRRRVEI
jgi:hypothetical protein